MVDDYSNNSSLDALYEAHESYMLDDNTAYGIIKDVTRNMKYWELLANKLKLPKSEMSLFSDRFEHGMEWKYGGGLHR